MLDKLKRFKKYLIINPRNIERKGFWDLYDPIIKKHKEIEVIKLEDKQQLDQNLIKEFIKYDGFQELIKKNWLKEFWDLPVSEATDRLYNDQEKYLNCPIYYVWDSEDDALFTLECGLEEFKYRFYTLDSSN